MICHITLMMLKQVCGWAFFDTNGEGKLRWVCGVTAGETGAG